MYGTSLVPYNHTHLNVKTPLRNTTFYCESFCRSMKIASQSVHPGFESGHSIAAPPTTATGPPVMAQSGDSIAPAADFVEAVLAELEVAVLILELVAVLVAEFVLDTEVGSAQTQRVSVAAWL